MKKLQNSLAAKVCVWVVLLAAAFGTGLFGVQARVSFRSVVSDSWQDSVRYQNAVENRRLELVEGIHLSQELELLEQQMEAGRAGPLAYADAEYLREQRAAVEERFSRDNTWFRFRVLTDNGQTLLGTNLREDETLSGVVQTVHYFSFELREGESYVYYEDPYAEADITPVAPKVEGESAEAVKVVLEYGVPEEINTGSVFVHDEFTIIRAAWQNDRAFFDHYLTGFCWLGGLMLFALIWILWTAGHKKGEEGVVLSWQDRIFFDLYAAAAIAAVVMLACCTIWAGDQLYWGTVNSYAIQNEDFETFFNLGVMGTGALFAAGVGCSALLLRTLAVRLKARCLANTTLLCRVVSWTLRSVHEFVQCLPFTWKMVLGFGIYVLFTFWLIARGVYDGFFLLIYWVIQLAVVCFIAWWTYGYYRLRQGTKTIAGGDLEYQIDTRRMPYDLRLQAEDLNNISVGLAGAVDEKMKSERFKAELITNVSHDLKTPLTSIINYVNLLKSTEQTDPKARDYIEVLDRKSQRLKKLTEDLVEASKASTGVLSVTREKIGMSQLIDQALGEWEEKLVGRKLTLVTTLPEGETWVYADGRHLWRVLDNLLSNCAKYAMEGTRIYLDLERGKGQVALQVKNISREPLNVPAERLMERFVRGEESRSTEGSGLGLSIARSLTELQGGSFELAVDGDLFKAIVTLPQAT